MSDLLKINVNDHTERKNGLTYLSWAWAWAEVLKIDPGAMWVAHTYGPPGSEEPCMRVGKSAMVHVSVTIKGLRRECMLPVMDHRNKAIPDPDAFQVNTAIMRCLAKAIAMHGLGLYIYAGEDLPEGDDEKPADPRRNGPVNPVAEVANAWARNASPDRVTALDELALYMIDCHKAGNDMDAIRVWYDESNFAADDQQEERTYVWGLLKTESKLRSAIKANKPVKEAA